jgi:4-hydroxythreonine-4-phosphate dehydrogenase
MHNPIIVIPMGDPNGIGPEIILKSLIQEEIFQYAKPFVVGNAHVLRETAKAMGLCADVHTVLSLEGEKCAPGVIPVRHVETEGMENLQIGRVQKEAGLAAFEYIKTACDLALRGQAAAMATTPINKESLRAAGVDFIGHTEILAALTQTEDPLTMFEVRNLRVFFLSRHVSLTEAISLCKKDRIVNYIKRCWAALKQLGVKDGVMAVAGLNPHCGEHGLFGFEEVNEIEPAVLQAQTEGYAVAGPIGADSVFAQTLDGRYNSVLSLYHDQGHIATKTLDFERTISLTIGMPFLRTSVDHGTALDIAGQGIASEVSMIEAIRLAAKYAPLYSAAVR